MSGKSALVVGGTRGIGKALTAALQADGWTVAATGHAELDLADRRTWDRYMRGLLLTQFDFVCFAAGDIDPFPWDRKTEEDYLRSYWIHALGPLLLLSTYKVRFPWWAKICFVTSVGATNAGVVDLSYGMAKAALDKIARALTEHSPWDVHLVRFDLVETDTLYRLPTETLHGRPVISAAEAAEQIMRECGL